MSECCVLAAGNVVAVETCLRSIVFDHFSARQPRFTSDANDISDFMLTTQTDGDAVCSDSC